MSNHNDMQTIEAGEGAEGRESASGPAGQGEGRGREEEAVGTAGTGSEGRAEVQESTTD